MAKTQGVSLAPSEITGMCGRLRCCLAYENDAYVEARKSLPREKERIETPYGEGKVIGISPLIKAVNVLLADGNIKEISLAELEGESISAMDDDFQQTARDEETQTEIASEKKRKSTRKRGRRRPIKRRKKK
jgi:cell fate regulator YaaT (PSP1 superfamily)